MPPRPAPAALPPPFAAESPSLAPAGQTHQATLPYGVDPVPSPPGLGPHGLQRPAAMAAAGSSLAAARPGGYRDGAEDATTVPSAAIATTAVTAWWLWSGPVIAGTVSVLPFSWYGGGWPPFAAPRPGSPSTVPAGTPPGYCWASCWPSLCAVANPWARSWAPFTSWGAW